MTGPILSAKARNVRVLIACIVLGIEGLLIGLFGYQLQKSPSNFGCFAVVFTFPLGIFAGWVVAMISGNRRMTTLQFLLFLTVFAVVAGYVVLKVIAIQQ